MPETSVQRRDEALPDKSGVSMSSISLSLEAETCPEDVRFVRYSRQLCNIVGSVKSLPVAEDDRKGPPTYWHPGNVGGAFRPAEGPT